MRRLEITGDRYGKLVALRRGSKNKYNRFNWYFRCDCGNIIELDANLARTGNTKSCGCYHAEALSLHKTTHGFTKDGTVRTEYRIWGLMKDRCGNPRTPSYKNYGGRGIAVCERWLNFENFYADMGPRPSLQHSIDRIDVNGNYEPGNCRWALPSVQGSNRRNNLLITWNSETMTASQWGCFLGVSGKVLDARLRRGWDFEVAVYTPMLGKIRRSRATREYLTFKVATEPK